MADILKILADSTLERVRKSKKIISPDEMMEKAFSVPKGNFEFEKALDKKDTMAFICEVKKASPSKNIIAEYFPYKEIASEYEKAGADCISVLTEPEYFKGDIKYLDEITDIVSVPVIRKDFTIDEYMIYEAHTAGAKAVLLICSLLDTDTLKKYISVCDKLGITALVEAHDKDEIKSALKAGARVIGVNNRNLKTFEVDIENSVNLRKNIPEDILFVAESGIKTPDDIARLREAGTNAVLIGETLMRSENKKECLDYLKGVL